MDWMAGACGGVGHPIRPGCRMGTVVGQVVFQEPVWVGGHMGMDIGGTPVGGGSELAVHVVDRDWMAVCWNITVSRAVEAIGAVEPVPSHVDRVAGISKGGSLKGPQDL